jgi:hypothetical protein
MNLDPLAQIQPGLVLDNDFRCRNIINGSCCIRNSKLAEEHNFGHECNISSKYISCNIYSFLLSIRMNKIM